MTDGRAASTCSAAGRGLGASLCGAAWAAGATHAFHRSLDDLQGESPLSVCCCGNSLRKLTLLGTPRILWNSSRSAPVSSGSPLRRYRLLLLVPGDLSEKARQTLTRWVSATRTRAVQFVAVSLFQRVMRYLVVRRDSALQA